MTRDVTAQPLFDGTFSTDAVASAASALVQQLHDEAMATIAVLADTWDAPVENAPAARDEEQPTYRDPATWSVDLDEDDRYPEEEEEVRVLPRVDLPPLLLARSAAHALAGAATDEFEVPVRRDRQLAAL